MIEDIESTTALVSMITQLWSKTPYQIHKTSLAAAIRNMSNEMSFADRSFQVLITCGKNVKEVIAPAEYPSISVKLKWNNFNF